MPLYPIADNVNSWIAGGVGSRSFAEMIVVYGPTRTNPGGWWDRVPIPVNHFYDAPTGVLRASWAGSVGWPFMPYDGLPEDQSFGMAFRLSLPSEIASITAAGQSPRIWASGSTPRRGRVKAGRHQAGIVHLSVPIDRSQIQRA